MTEIEYRNWWQLHLRVARGETLTSTEQLIYDAGEQALDQEEASEISVGY